MEPGLMLDVGAAAGIFTKMMLKRSAGSHVIAFEPFPGNFAYFEKNVVQDPRVTLHRAAVSDCVGEVSFFVSSVVAGKEPGWEDYAGYSSLGHIVDENSPKVSSSIKVPAIKLDDVVTEHVRFCKIDVQGGEASVLRGADKLIRDHGVDIFYVEFGGEEPILAFLQERGYVFYDNAYLLVATRNKPSLEQWKVEKPVALSTGKDAYEAWPRNAPRPFGDYCTWLREQKKSIRNVQTDMVCVHESFVPKFLHAAADALRTEAHKA
jgi:FkbM family methyltransferase